MKFKLTSSGDKEPDRGQIIAIVVVHAIIILLAILYVIGKYV